MADDLGGVLRCGMIDVSYYETGSFVRHGLRGCPPDTAASPRDEADPVGEAPTGRQRPDLTGKAF